MLPVIETERLIIRTPMLGDEIQLNKAINESLPEIQRWMPWAKDPSIEPTRQFVTSAIESWRSEQQKDFPMVAVHKETQKIIGASGYNDRSNPLVPYFEIGYWLATEYTGRGLATELVQALTGYAFDSLKAARVQIIMQVENTKSIRVAEKCGYQLEARLHNHGVDCRTGKPSDDLVYMRLMK